MSVITTNAHPKALWPGVYAWWGKEVAEHPVEYTDLFDMDNSSQQYEELVETTGFGLAPVKGQGASVSYQADSQGYVSRATHVAYALGYIVTREEIADNLYEAVSKRRATMLAFSMRQTQETVAANVYNRAFNASYTIGDGVSWLNASHPTKSGTQSNVLSTAADLSETAIEDMVIQVMGAENSNGLKINLMPRSLHVSRHDYFEACRILESVQQSGTANNDVNVIRSKGIIPGGAVINHYFTDNDAWFIRTNAPMSNVGFNRESLEFTQDNDSDTYNAKAKAYQRYSFVIGDWRGTYGSAGA